MTKNRVPAPATGCEAGCGRQTSVLARHGLGSTADVEARTGRPPVHQLVERVRRPQPQAAAVVAGLNVLAAGGPQAGKATNRSATLKAAVARDGDSA